MKKKEKKRKNREKERKKVKTYLERTSVLGDARSCLRRNHRRKKKRIRGYNERVSSRVYFSFAIVALLSLSLSRKENVRVLLDKTLRSPRQG